MTTNSTTAEDRLAKLGIHLPDAPTPFGAYVPAVQTGNLLFLSGMLATSGHTATVVGIVGKDLDVKAGREAAYTAALNVLALAKSTRHTDFRKDLPRIEVPTPGKPISLWIVAIASCLTAFHCG